MFGSKLRKIGYGWMALQGLLSLLLPRQSLKLNLKLLGSGFENPTELQPRDWYVRQTRALGAGLVVAGLTGLLLEDRGDGSENDNVSVEKVE
ncbi:hypothetical protein ACFQL3_14755 [Natronoarchaeum sp. GCM10025321]|uniref:hypothetical protein n=1 Tax=Natronoarchaeum sp. GCM10025321 TaxID=3252684 RepID=UPI00362027CD